MQKPGSDAGFLIWNGIAAVHAWAEKRRCIPAPAAAPALPCRNWSTSAVTGQERAIAICFVKADARSLRIQSTAKAEIIFALVHGAGAVFHLPRPSRALGDNRDKLLDIEARFLAEMMPSARPCTRPAMQIWFTIFASWPEPTGPIRPSRAGISLNDRLCTLEDWLGCASHYRQYAVSRHLPVRPIQAHHMK